MRSERWWAWLARSRRIDIRRLALLMLGLAHSACGGATSASASDAPAAAGGTDAAAAGTAGAAGANNDGITLLVEGLVNAGPLAVDEQNIYWISTSLSGAYTLNAMPKAGGPITVLDENDANMVASDAGDLYWGDQQGLLRRAAGSTGAVLLTDAVTLSVAFDSSHVYYQDFDRRALESEPKAGGEPTPLTAAPGLDPVALSGGQLFWTTRTGNEEFRLMKLALPAASKPELVATLAGQVHVLGLVIVGQRAFIGTRPGVLAVDLVSGDVSAATSDAEPYAAVQAADADFLYYAPIGQGGAVRKLSLASGEVTTIAQAVFPGAVVLDDQYVYWSEGGVDAEHGKIWRAPRC